MPDFSRAIVLIGDVLRSRSSPNRVDLHGDLVRALSAVNADRGCDLRITVGDEYQGTVGSLGEAIAVTRELRLALLPTVDVRHGIGRGPVTVLDEKRGIEDGPAWWAAREAIDAAKSYESSPALRLARTAFRSAGDEPAAPAVNAALLSRDALIGAMDLRSLSGLRALLGGQTQRSWADVEGISPSAASQRVARDRLGVVTKMSEWLEGLP